MPLVRVADVKHAPGIPLNSDRLTRCPGKIAIATAIEPGDAAHVIPGLGIVWNTGAPGHCTGSSVVGSQAEWNVAAIAFQQTFQVPDSCVDVFFRVERVI